MIRQFKQSGYEFGVCFVTNYSFCGVLTLSQSRFSKYDGPFLQQTRKMLPINFQF